MPRTICSAPFARMVSSRMFQNTLALFIMAASPVRATAPAVVTALSPLGSSVVRPPTSRNSSSSSHATGAEDGPAVSGDRLPPGPVALGTFLLVVLVAAVVAAVRAVWWAFWAGTLLGDDVGQARAPLAAAPVAAAAAAAAAPPRKSTPIRTVGPRRPATGQACPPYGDLTGTVVSA
jgi:hypothetical protein